MSVVISAGSQWVADPVPPSGKDHEEQAAEDPHTDGRDVEHLLGLVPRRRVEATHHVSVPQGHGSEHKNGQYGVDPIDECESVLPQV
ncbi:hypothetical protein SAY87_027450 [Trapa incisa]|uniref:Uncharacterized protein n=1 Tax=Trapa incisa TaxID=236973 RepID=A0AAN7GRS6_9MYRT|nr:hypothetical protein SAY87_027450 [Trapa incisa]